MNVLFEVHAITCKNIRTTKSYWKYIVEVKHPESFKNIEHQKAIEMVKRTLEDPKIIIRERIDPSIYLYYRRFDKYLICVVTKHLNGDGYIITSYRTDRIKRGETI